MSGYKRVLLKLSGEVFGGGRVGVDPDVVKKIAQEIAVVAPPSEERTSRHHGHDGVRGQPDGLADPCRVSRQQHPAPAFGGWLAPVALEAMLTEQPAQRGRSRLPLGKPVSSCRQGLTHPGQAPG